MATYNVGGGSGGNVPGFIGPLLGEGGYTHTETTVLPERVIANTDPSARSALGRPLPAVIGTGRVEGIYFIGGVVQTDTVTTTTTTETTFPEGTVVQVMGNPNAAQQYASHLHVFGQQMTTTTDSTTTSKTVTRAGYVLAYDFWERGYDLIRLEINGDLVYDTENALASSVSFRFYGGRQATSIDPIVEAIVEDNPGAYQNMVMLFIDGYPSDTPPSVSAVISNAATDQAEDAQIYFTGDPPSPPLIDADTIDGAAYDPSQNILYEMGRSPIVNPQSGYLIVLDIDTKLERYRIRLAEDAYTSAFVKPLIGTQYVFVRYGNASILWRYGVYDSISGRLLAQYVETVPTVNIVWDVGDSFEGRYYFIGHDASDEVWIATIDIAAETLSVVNYPTTLRPMWVRGRTSDDGISFYGFDPKFAGIGGDGLVYEFKLINDVWSGELVYTAPGTVQAVWFDPLTDYLLVSYRTDNLAYINPDTGAVIDSFTTAVQFDQLNSQHAGDFQAPNTDRFWARPGFALFPGFNDDNVYLLNIQDKTYSLYATMPADGPVSGVFDQRQLFWIEGIGEERWTVHYLPNQVPGLIDLSDVVTDVMALPGFTSGDLTFVGFGGLSTYGYTIAADTNIQSAIRILSDIYDFYWCDTGSGFVYKKPQTDLALTIDATFDSSTIVNREDPVQSSDEGNVRTPSAVEMEYVSKENAYRPMPASFSMTVGALNSITTPRFSTPILFDDAEAKRITIEKFFQYQERRRAHGVVVAPEYAIMLPGDVVRIPSGTVTYTSVVGQVSVDFRDMSVELGVQDFASEVDTTVTAVSNNVPVSVLVQPATLYLHLDIPLLRYGHDLDGTGLVQYGMLAPRGQSFWTGGTLLRGSNATTLIRIFDQARHLDIVGIANSVFDAPADPFATTDTATVQVRRIIGDAGRFVNATEAEVLTEDANLAIIGNNGRWELVGYTTVTDLGDDLFELSGFVRRGYHGSEVWAGTHVVGDWFILVDMAVIRNATHPITDLDATFYYKAVGAGQLPGSVLTVTHTIPGVAETPYAVVNITATNDSPPHSPRAGIDISWDYRSRVADGLNPADFGEATLAFEIEILDNSSPPVILRTLTATDSNVNYSDADVIADWGSYPDELTVRIYMMSALDIVVPGQTPVVPGRGYMSQGHILFDTGDFTFDSEVITFDSETITWDAA